MTQKDAKKEVQKLLKQAADLLVTAGALMDEHQFSTTFLGVDYIPRNMEFNGPGDLEEGDQSDEWVLLEPKSPDLGHFWFSKVDYESFAGEWASSSSWRGC